MTADGWPLAARGHRAPAVVAAKVARIDEPHVKPLNAVVREINDARGAGSVPWFDPDGGGANARILFLLECPGPKATQRKGSGLISADNDDPTAANFFALREAAPWLTRVVDLLPDLRRVVLMGKRAQRGWAMHLDRPGSRGDVPPLPTPHLVPSPA